MTSAPRRPPGVPDADDVRRGALFALAAAAAFAVMATCVKLAARSVGNEMIVFFRSAVGLLALLPWLLRRGVGVLATRRLAGHAWRAGFGICAMYCFFYALAHLPMADAIVLTYSTPLFIPFFAWAVLREPPSPLVLGAVALGLGGIVLIARPGAGGMWTAAGAIGALSGICAAAAMVTIRRIADTEPATRIVFYFSALSTVVAAVPLAWAWQTPAPAVLGLLAGTGLFATAGQLCLTRAYALAPAARIGAFTYVAVVFAGLIGWALWDERPDAQSLAGMVLVIGCCLVAGWRATPAPRHRAPAVVLTRPPA
jgi:drug/metabolite transporter (DMT)-like permease